MAFAWLVTKASWRDVTVRYKDRAITLNRGQLSVSVRDMAIKLDRSRQWADRFMSRLTLAGIIETSSETGVNVVTIRNYDLYQRPWDSVGTAVETPPGQRRDSAGTQNNEGNKDKEGKEGKKGGAFALPDWIEEDLWAGWEDYRNQINKPMTDRARSLVVGKLKKARDMGYTPREVIEKSIMSNWWGVWEPKADKSTPKPMGGMSFAQARDRIKELERETELMLIQLPDRPSLLDKYKANKTELEDLRKAVEWKGR